MDRRAWEWVERNHLHLFTSSSSFTPLSSNSDQGRHVSRLSGRALSPRRLFLGQFLCNDDVSVKLSELIKLLEAFWVLRNLGTNNMAISSMLFVCPLLLPMTKLLLSPSVIDEAIKTPSLSSLPSTYTAEPSSIPDPCVHFILFQ